VGRRHRGRDPFIDRLRPLVDLREQVVAFLPQPVITEDSVTISTRSSPVVSSNAATVIGKRAVVTVPIAGGPENRGQVRIVTEFWSARSTGEQSIDEGTTVDVVALDGVAAVVTPVPDTPLRQ
jgi:membrane protein implicated in regulation of membrane protease activity